MRALEIFRNLRKQKIRFGLKRSMTVLVSGLVIVSLLLALGISELLQWIFPILTRTPILALVLTFAIVLVAVTMYYMSGLFFDPIKQLRDGMQRVADGDFDTRVETKSSSVEIQELVAGFNMMAEELGTTEMLQTDFVSNVSHEFKTPINAIEGYAMLLQSAESEELKEEYVEKILFNTGRLSTLVSNILLLSKIENQTIPTNRELYDLDEQIREDIVATEPLWEKKNIEFDVELESIEYFGNESLMHHVWTNLISNAIKFSPESSTVYITLAREGDSAVFSIRNYGPHIPDEAKKHIYDKFYQADLSHKADGNGLGLSLVKRIVAIFNGKIGVENVEEGGCEFTVTLPL